MLSNEQRGFTLIELVLASTFIATAAVGLMTLFSSTARMNRQGQNLSLTTQLAQQKLEEYRNIPYTSISPTPPVVDFATQLPSQIPSPRTATINITETEPGLKKIDIAITYPDYGATRSIQVSTYVTSRGINK